MRTILTAGAVLLLSLTTAASSAEFKVQSQVSFYYYAPAIAKAAAESQLFMNAQAECETQLPGLDALALRRSKIMTTTTRFSAAATATFRCDRPGNID